MNETRWVRWVAIVPAIAVVSFGTVGLIAADAGAYRQLFVFPIGLAVFLVLLRAVRPVIAAPSANDRASHLAGIGAVVLAAGMGCWNALYASEHVLTDRDPAIYNNTARWIARSGNLEFAAWVGPFRELPFVVSAPGVLPVEGQADLQFQSAHLLPTLLAEARGIGGDHLMFMLPALVGACALLAFFVVASRVLHNPFGALAATACLAFTLPEVNFSRDAYSEIPTQLLLFTALWMLCDESVLRRWAAAFVVGLSLGLLQAVRIDALAIIVLVPVAFAAAWIRQRDRSRKSLLAGIAAAATGVGLGLVLGIADLRLRSHPYLADLRRSLFGLFALTAVVGVGAAVAAVVAPRLRRASRPYVNERRRLLAANALAVVTVLVGVGAWLVRSHLDPLPDVVQPTSALAAAGLPVPDHSPYSAHSLAWVAWYLGPVTIALAVIAAGLLVRALILRVRWEWLVAAVLLAPGTVLYLWRPHAHPDQVWVTRRMIVCAFPAAILLAFGLILVLATQARRLRSDRGRVLARGAALALGFVAVAYPMWTVMGVRSMTEQRDFRAVVQDACTIMGPNAALVVLSEKTSAVHLTAPVPIRTWCGIPAAQYQGAVDPAVLERAASQWRAQGRQLWIGAERPDTIRAVFPSARPKATRKAINAHQLDRPLTHKPTGYVTETFQLNVAPVPAG